MLEIQAGNNNMEAPKALDVQLTDLKRKTGSSIAIVSAEIF